MPPSAMLQIRLASIISCVSPKIKSLEMVAYLHIWNMFKKKGSFTPGNHRKPPKKPQKSAGSRSEGI
jgi:hypothetical protein